MTNGAIFLQILRNLAIMRGLYSYEETTMMQKWVLGNHKMALTNPSQLALFGQIAPPAGVVVGLAPSFLHFTHLQTHVQHLLLGAQDISAYESGAYTGEVSGAQLAQAGAGFVLVGHSERRYYHNEGNALLSRKLHCAHGAGLTVVFCVGESKAQREAGTVCDALDNAILPLIDFARTHPDASILVAYEPLWAIGTGKMPMLEEIAQAHGHIKTRLDVPVLYGGSVTGDNAKDIAHCKALDGVLVGGASLAASSFLPIVQAFANS